MSTVSKKELLNEAFITAGAVGVSMAVKNMVGMPLNTLETLKGAAAISTMVVKCTQVNNYLPVDLCKCW